MRQSPKDDAELGETRAVLERLQRFSDDPDNFEFRPASERGRARTRLLVAVSVVGAIAAGGAGAFVYLGPQGLPGATAALKAPSPPPPPAEAIKAAPAPPSEPTPPKLVMVVPSGQKVIAQSSPDRGDKGAGNPKTSAEEAARAEQLLARGDAYLADGNVMGARDFFERAADIGLAAAAIRMAETYDPGTLQRLQALGVVPDPNQARKWYERARSLGAREATEPLSRLTAK